MRYLGGKSKTAKAIADVIQPRGLWWEPFCGGLHVSTKLAAFGPGVISDANEALISLYQGVRSGWNPPEEAALSDWEDAKSLPNTDPRKAFFGIGCSFRGMWFQSSIVERRLVWHKKQRYWNDLNAVGATRKALLRDVPAVQNCAIMHADFLSCDTPPGIEVIYCDPPYQGTTGYAAVGAFDHAKFWVRCQELARNCLVYVSEYQCPIPHIEVWNQPSGCSMAGVASGTDRRTARRGNRVERLFQIL